MQATDSMNMENMSGMSMTSMSMSPAPMMHHMAPSPAPMNAHMTMDMSHMSDSMESMNMMMMWFQATTTATLWLREWTTDSKGK